MLYNEVVRDPRFAEQVGNVVLEFGGAGAQDIIDRYVNGEDVSFTGLRHVWTDVVGWLPGPFYWATSISSAMYDLLPETSARTPDQDLVGRPHNDWKKIN